MGLFDALKMIMGGKHDTSTTATTPANSQAPDAASLQGQPDDVATPDSSTTPQATVAPDPDQMVGNMDSMPKMGTEETPPPMSQMSDTDSASMDNLPGTTTVLSNDSTFSGTPTGAPNMNEVPPQSEESAVPSIETPAMPQDTSPEQPTSNTNKPA